VAPHDGQAHGRSKGVTVAEYEHNTCTKSHGGIVGRRRGAEAGLLSGLARCAHSYLACGVLEAFVCIKFALTMVTMVSGEQYGRSR
jgi:hypothetical protein